jgi:N-acetylglutamate synthase-like GNAT family acetyltransferase
MMFVRKARQSEAEAISALALRSKAHWNYTEKELAVFRSELKVESEEVVPHRMHVIEESGQIVGFYSLVPCEGNTVELGHLFVEPKHLGRGFGRALFEQARETARDAGFARLVIQSDPNAAGFYLSLGASLDRQIPSSIPGRTLPYFTLELRE